MQNHTLKMVLRPEKAKKNGLIPIYLRLTVDRKSSYKSTRYFIDRKQWNERMECVVNHPYAGEINLELMARKREHLEKLINDKTQGKKIKATLSGGDVTTDIFLYCEHHLTVQDKNYKLGRKRLYWYLVQKLKAFSGSETLAFNDVDKEYLKSFELWLLNGGLSIREGSDGMGTVANIMGCLSALFNYNKDNVLHYPFGKGGYQKPKIRAGDKEYLSMEELEHWLNNVEALHESIRCYGVWFLFGCFTGLRVSDWIKFDFKKKVRPDHILTRAVKNKEIITVPMYDRLRRVAEMAEANPLKVDYIDMINDGIRECALALGIDKRLSSHCGRRTFAVTMCLERGVSSETAAKMMGITLETFVRSYSHVTPHKIRLETGKAWAGL